ncbi:hypothetical protein [Synechococcus sp. MIT S1220]|uniref:hypothetical protein n=1 Tax=Synechococcus sp. MIT S1220 TaxID=3082549 RepID=UPI0039B11C21
MASIRRRRGQLSRSGDGDGAEAGSGAGAGLGAGLGAGSADGARFGLVLAPALGTATLHKTKTNPYWYRAL